jgi:hypothetical protein
MHIPQRKTHRTPFHALYLLAAVGLCLACPTQPLSAQTADIKAADITRPASYRTFHIQHMVEQGEINDLTTDLRNMLPNSRIYAVYSRAAISVRGSQDDLALAEKMLEDLDRSRGVYRLNYAVTEVENGQRLGTRHFSLQLTSGARSELKQGSRVPIVTASQDPSQKDRPQVQYIDVGMNIRAWVDGTHLHTIVEESGISDEHSGLGSQDPIIRQTSLDVTTLLAQGKPVALGSIDVPNSTRHQEIEVISEPMP